jgi:hypothetical protein
MRVEVEVVDNRQVLGELVELEVVEMVHLIPLLELLEEQI